MLLKDGVSVHIRKMDFTEKSKTFDIQGGFKNHWLTFQEATLLNFSRLLC